VVELETPRRELKRLHAAGVRGLRLNFQTLRERYAGDAAQWLAKFERLVARPGFQTVLRLPRSGNIWVKLAGADRITRRTGKLRDAVPFIKALAAAAPERLVWGSDSPNIGFHQRKPEHLYDFGS
jgi:predicted TIM-barrel fold metal-dependent hydrolase